MIGKILPHKPTFGRRTSYARYEKNNITPRDEWTITRNLEGVDPDYAHIVMAATAKQSRRVKVPCGHMILSWAANDYPGNEQMVQQTDQAMRDLGLSQHQAIYVAHDDTDHRHVHVVFNRVHPETFKAASDSNERHKLRQSLMRQEQEYGLTQTPEKSRGRHQRPLFSEIEIAKREDRIALARMSKQRCDKLKEELAYCFKSAMGWSSFHGMLKRRGYDLKQAGPSARIIRHHQFAKLSDVLPPKMSSKKLTQKWGKISKYLAEIEPPKERKRQKSNISKTQKEF